MKMKDITLSPEELADKNDKSPETMSRQQQIKVPTTNLEKFCESGIQVSVFSFLIVFGLWVSWNEKFLWNFSEILENVHYQVVE